MKEVKNEKKDTLFGLVAQANTLSAMLAETCGEITPEIEKLMEHVDVALPEKIDGYSVVMDRLEHEAEFYKARADLYSKVAKAHLSIQERIKSRIKSAMLEMNIDELKGNDVRFKLSKLKPKLVISDPEAIPEELKIVVQTKAPDKDRISEVLAEGFEVAGAKMEPVYSLRSYVNKKGA